MKSKKQALLTSGLCLGLSAALLTGATFAWFTDSVTNKGNTIQAGNLDVTFGYRALTESDQHSPYTEVTETTDLFNGDMQWEPGRSYGYDFQVGNAGNLWMNFVLNFSNLTGDTQLADVLDVYVYNDTRVNTLDGATRLGTVSEVMNSENGIYSMRLNPGNNQQFSVVVKMQETAGNEYQGLSVDFDLALKAKQGYGEQDGFGNANYDAEATYDQVVVEATGSDTENGAALAKAITEAKEGSTIFVGAGTYDMPRSETPVEAGQNQSGWYFAIAQDNVKIVGDKDAVITSSVESPNGAWASQNMVTIFGDNVTLEGFTIISKDEVNKAIEVVGKNSTIRNVNIQCAEHTPNFGGSIYYSASDIGNAVLENVNVEKAWVSTTAVITGTLTMSNVTLDFAGCVYGGSPISANAKDIIKVNGSLVLNVASDETNQDELNARLPQGATVNWVK